MRDVELYKQLVGLVAPWTVGRVQLSVESERVDIWVEHAPEERWPCPECATSLSIYDHSEERKWRHLDSCQFKTFLHARPRRIKCPLVPRVRLTEPVYCQSGTKPIDCYFVY